MQSFRDLKKLQNGASNLLRKSRRNFVKMQKFHGKNKHMLKYFANLLFKLNKHRLKYFIKIFMYFANLQFK